jgi:hypothetical protein
MTDQSVTSLAQFGLFLCDDCGDSFAGEIPSWNRVGETDEPWPTCPHGCKTKDDPLVNVTTPADCPTYTLPRDTFRPRLLEPLQQIAT